MTKNPLTFKDIDPAQASAHTGIPRSPVIGNTANEVHNMGEVWCVTLWEARANLIGKLRLGGGQPAHPAAGHRRHEPLARQPEFPAGARRDPPGRPGGQRRRQPRRAVGGVCQARHGLQRHLARQLHHHRPGRGLRRAGRAADHAGGRPCRHRPGGRAVHTEPRLLHPDQLGQPAP